MPLISVILPIYNAQRYLDAAVKSILAQSFSDFELIAINDGSTDRSLDILYKHADRDRRVRIVTRQNKGLVATLNEGLMLAKGSLIARMDADDVALPGRFAAQARYMAEHPEVVLLGGWYEMIDHRGRLITVMRMPTEHDEIDAEMLAGHTPLCHPTAMMRRDKVLTLGGYRAEMMLAEDLDLWLRLAEVGKVAILPEPMLRYRVHANSVSEQAGEKQRRVARSACEAAYRRRGIEPRFAADESARPLSDRSSKHRFAILYGWWAFNEAQRMTALSYAIRGVRLKPMNIQGWKLLVCSLVKPMRIRRGDAVGVGHA
ncbi:MAG: glycosyltransferase [Phycisphaera sp.]|nr:glycosyltransferase [Phycisphaera sp.]